MPKSKQIMYMIQLQTRTLDPKKFKSVKKSSSKVELFMMENGTETSGRDTVSRFGLMEPNTKVNGSRTKLRGKANLHMLMETFMMVTGKKTRLRAMVYTLAKMEVNTKANGPKTTKMV
jgi:hypothetical protein